MGWPFFLFLAVAILSTALHLRLAAFRRDQARRRQRGRLTGDPLLSIGYGEDLKASLYTPRGRRFLPWVVALDALAVGALMFWLYWSTTR